MVLWLMAQNPGLYLCHIVTFKNAVKSRGEQGIFVHVGFSWHVKVPKMNGCVRVPGLYLLFLGVLRRKLRLQNGPVVQCQIGELFCGLAGMQTPCEHVCVCVCMDVCMHMFTCVCVNIEMP